MTMALIDSGLEEMRRIIQFDCARLRKKLQYTVNRDAQAWIEELERLDEEIKRVQVSRMSQKEQF
jgi:hypothetical protein